VRFKIQDTKEQIETTSMSTNIASIEFQIMSNNDIAQLAELEVVSSRLYNEGSLTPTAYGLLDPKLGVSSKGAICSTCNEKYIECPGHYGYIKLELPVYHIGFFKHVLSILQCICKNCSKVLLTDQSKKKYIKLKAKTSDTIQKDKLRRQMIDECKNTKICQYCDSFNGTVKKEPGIACKIIHDQFDNKKLTNDDHVSLLTQKFEKICKINKDVEWGLNKMQQDINPLIAYNLLKNIPKEDTPLFDMAGDDIKPHDMIINYVIVPPI
jgi:DNA-directed RNA polymerase III subunit RPC1